MDIKKTLLLLLITLGIENKLFSMKRTREELNQNIQNQNQPVVQTNGLDFTDSNNLPYELTEKIIEQTIVNILEDCHTGEDFKKACKKICNLRLTNKKTKQTIDNLLNKIEYRLNKLEFNEQNLELDYRFVLFFMLKNDEIINEKPFFKDILLDMYAKTLSNIDLAWKNMTESFTYIGGSIYYQSTLICSIEAKHFRLSELLIKMGTDVDLISEDGNALHYLLGYCKETDSQQDHKLRILKLLLEANIDVNYDGEGSYNYAIFHALHRSDQRLALTLISHPEIDLNVHDEFGDSAFDFALQLGNYNIIKALVEKKVNINQKNDEQVTPLISAIIYQDEKLVELLLENGAKVNNLINNISTMPSREQINEAPKQEHQNDALILCLLDHEGKKTYIKNCKEKKKDISRFIQNLQYTGGFTELMIAVLTNNIEIVKLILNAGAYVHAINDQGETALHMALNNNVSLEIIKLLIQAETNITALSYKSISPLMYAIARCDIDTVKYLLSLPSIVNDFCVTRNVNFGQHVSKENLHLLNCFKYSQLIKSFMESLDIDNLDLTRIKEFIASKIKDNDINMTWFLLKLPVNINIEDFRDIIENHSVKAFRELLKQNYQKHNKKIYKNIKSELLKYFLSNAIKQADIYSIKVILAKRKDLYLNDLISDIPDSNQTTSEYFKKLIEEIEITIKKYINDQQESFFA